MATEFSGADFDAKVVNSNRVALIDFYSDNCPPCRQLAPLIDQLAAEQGDKAIVGKVNVANDADLAVKFGISVVPTILVFKDGEIVLRKTGLHSKEKLQELIDQQV